MPFSNNESSIRTYRWRDRETLSPTIPYEIEAMSIVFNELSNLKLVLKCSNLVRKLSWTTKFICPFRICVCCLQCIVGSESKHEQPIKLMLLNYNCSSQCSPYHSTSLSLSLSVSLSFFSILYMSNWYTDTSTKISNEVV